MGLMALAIDRSAVGTPVGRRVERLWPRTLKAKAFIGEGTRQQRPCPGSRDPGGKGCSTREGAVLGKLAFFFFNGM